MDRTEFLITAQRASVFSVDNVPQDLMVVYRGTKYIPIGYEMSFLKGVPVHKGILRDTKANAHIFAKLENLTKQE